MRNIIKGAEIEEFTKNVDKITNTVMIPEIDKMKTYARRAVWTGDIRDSFISKYDGVVKEIEKIPYVLSLYTEFLSKVNSNYEEALLEFQKKFNELNNELDYNLMKGNNYDKTSNF